MDSAEYKKYKLDNLKLRVVYTGYTVAMVTFYVKQMIITCLPIIEHSFDTIILKSTDIEWQ